MVPNQAPTAQNPGEEPFDDPAAGQWLEAADVLAAADDVEDDPEMPGGPVGEVAGVAAVGPDSRQPPEAARSLWQKFPGAVPVGHGHRCDQHGQEKSEFAALTA
ncbi:hypothetical protein SRO_0224 [Streptomyces rochei]|nr:hypothetical protein SRO_0224 [Streptomyces rochei]